MRFLPQLLLAAASLLSLSARAEVISYDFTGRVSYLAQIIDGMPMMSMKHDGFKVEMGDYFYGSVSYDTTSPATTVSTYPGGELEATYENAVVSFTLNIPSRGLKLAQVNRGDIDYEFAKYSWEEFPRSNFYMHGKTNVDIETNTYYGLGFEVKNETDAGTTAIDLASFNMPQKLEQLGASFGLYTPSTSEIYRYDLYVAAGELDTLTRVITPVPEPETYAMMLGGLGLIGFMARRRQKRA